MTIAMTGKPNPPHRQEGLASNRSFFSGKSYSVATALLFISLSVESSDKEEPNA
jgi:hypothetical protein